jgi:hypothetical protein
MLAFNGSAAERGESFGSCFQRCPVLPQLGSGRVQFQELF